MTKTNKKKLQGLKLKLAIFTRTNKHVKPYYNYLWTMKVVIEQPLAASSAIRRRVNQSKFFFLELSAEHWK